MTDLISRQAAIGTLDDEITITGKSNAYVVMDYVQRVKRKMENLPSAEPEWVPCSERLPEENGDYLVTKLYSDNAWGDELCVEVETYYTHPGTEEYGYQQPAGWQCSEKVIAWMPLPKSYQEA